MPKRVRAGVSFHSERLRRDREGRALERALVRKVPVPGVTIALMSLCALATLLAAMGANDTGPVDLPNLLDWGALYGPLVAQGQWVRLLSSVFLHVGFWHLFANLLVLYPAGVLGERLFGQLTFLAIFLLCGITGSVAGLLVHPGLVGAGASGAVLGCVAAVLAFLLRNPEERRIVPLLGAFWTAGIVFTLYVVAMGSLSFFGAFANVGHATHAAGAAAGFGAGLVLARPAPSRRRRALATSGILLCCVLFAGAGLFFQRPVDDAVGFFLDLQRTEIALRPVERERFGPTGAGYVDVPAAGVLPALGVVDREKTLARYRALLERAKGLHHVDRALVETLAEFRSALRERVAQLSKPPSPG